MKHAVERMHNINKEIFFNYQWAETGSGEGGGMLPRKIVSMEFHSISESQPLYEACLVANCLVSDLFF